MLPLITGRIADLFGLRTGMCLLYVTFCWVFAISLWPKPLIAKQKSGGGKPKSIAE